MKRRLLIVLILLSTMLQAQEKDIIKGVVRDNNKQPVPFVNISVIQNTRVIASTSSDINGNYKVAIPDTLNKFTLNFTYIGMKKKEIKINRKAKKDEPIK